MDLTAPQDASEEHGDDLARYLPDVLETAEITHVQISTFDKMAGFHGDTASDAAREITSAARAEHLERHFGFWEYALRAAVDADRPTRDYLIQGALRHAGGTEDLKVVSLEEFTKKLRTAAFDGLPERMIVSLTSPVRIRRANHGPWHLPMLDLGVRISEAGENAAVDALQALGLKGALFESGRSYHFYGAEVATESSLWHLLGQAQLLSPIVDARWISHQLVDGRCGLRISTDLERHTASHRFVAHID